MEIIKKEFHVSIGETVNLYTLGDLHEGNVNHAEAELKAAVRIIRNDPNGYWIGMGDYIEAITPKDVKRFDPLSVNDKYKIRDLKDLPYRQVEYVFNNLKPIKDRCICLLTGNHEEAFSKHNENDIYNHFVQLFKNGDGETPPKMGYTGFLKLVFKHKSTKQAMRRKGKPHDVESLHLGSVVIYCNHGDGGGGMREGYGINKLHDVTRGIDADIHLMGHIHLLDEHSLKVTGINSVNGLVKRNKFWGLTGCFLYTYKEGNTNYFEHKGKPESPIGMLKISIRVDNNKHPFITVTKIQLG